MSKAVMQQALSAFEAIMFEKDAESCQIIAKNARYSLREALAQPICRDDGRCQYAIDHGAEGMGHCPVGKCCMPQPEQEPVNIHCPSCLHSFSIVPVAKREWVGLTGEERNEMIGRIQHDQYTRQRDLIGATQIITEMYLKEKNCG